mmetsp:Transcript_30314/g.76526  ORF Transcript_30314/g.76526 Transcript_30314/m.76526 type:complete len:397 (+) Transcript_30314:508-1698(+)
MRNHYRGPALHQLLQSFLNQVFRRLIQRRRRLIEQQDRGVCEDGPRNTDPLLLSARNVLDCAHLRLQAFRKFRFVAQGIPDVRGPARILDLLGAGLVLAPDADVVPDGHRDEVWLLRDSRNLGPKPLRIQVLHVVAIYANGASIHIVEPLQQTKDSALSAACFTNDANDLPGRHLKRGTLQDFAAFAVRILKGHTIEHNVSPCTAFGDQSNIGIDARPERDEIVRFRELRTLLLCGDPIVVRTLDLPVDLMRVVHHRPCLALAEPSLLHEVADNSKLRDLRALVHNLGRRIYELRDCGHTLVAALKIQHGLLEYPCLFRPTNKALIQRCILGPQRKAESFVVLRRHDNTAVSPILQILLQALHSFLADHTCPMNAYHPEQEEITLLPHPPSARHDA